MPSSTQSHLAGYQRNFQALYDERFMLGPLDDDDDYYDDIDDDDDDYEDDVEDDDDDVEDEDEDDEYELSAATPARQQVKVRQHLLPEWFDTDGR
jgi:hypothetical protein